MDQNNTNNTTPNTNLSHVTAPNNNKRVILIVLVILAITALGTVAYLKLGPSKDLTAKQNANAVINDSENKVENMDKNEFEQNLDGVDETTQEKTTPTPAPSNTTDLDAQIKSLDNMDINTDDSNLNDNSLNDLTN